MDGDEPIEEFVPYGERCHRGCTRRGVIRDGPISVLCARCFLALLTRQAAA
jgi:hypothetical protein